MIVYYGITVCAGTTVPTLLITCGLLRPIQTYVLILIIHHDHIKHASPPLCTTSVAMTIKRTPSSDYC